MVPVELHLPSFRFCRLGTKLEEILASDELGINKLVDDACRGEVIAYDKYKDNKHRSIADRVLAGKA